MTTCWSQPTVPLSPPTGIKQFRFKSERPVSPCLSFWQKWHSPSSAQISSASRTSWWTSATDASSKQTRARPSTLSPHPSNQTRYPLSGKRKSSHGGCRTPTWPCSGRHSGNPTVKHGVVLQIPMRGRPVFARSRRLPPDKLKAARVAFEEMTDSGVVLRSNSDWASPLHLVPKADGSWRPCGDFRCLNDITIADQYPVSHIQDFSAQLTGCKVFSKVNLVRGYHQIPVTHEDVHKTAVITPFGLYKFLRTPFGLKNAARPSSG